LEDLFRMESFLPKRNSKWKFLEVGYAYVFSKKCSTEMEGVNEEEQKALRSECKKHPGLLELLSPLKGVLFVFRKI
jgi:hypothetical protein